MSEPIFYNYFRSSASYRVRIVLFLKNIDFEYRSVHLLKEGGQQHKQEFLGLNPMAQVPCWVHDQGSLGQSMAIIDHLEQKWPQPPLFPMDPWNRAQAIEICEIVNSGIQPLQNLGVAKQLKAQFQAEEKDVAQWHQFWISRGLRALEEKLATTAGSFCLGGQVTVADAFVIPQVFAAQRFGVSVVERSHLLRVYENCMELEAFQKASPSKQPDTP